VAALLWMAEPGSLNIPAKLGRSAIETLFYILLERASLGRELPTPQLHFLRTGIGRIFYNYADRKDTIRTGSFKVQKQYSQL
jgi:hypothetical protein